MRRDGPSCLDGPATRNRQRWLAVIVPKAYSGMNQSQPEKKKPTRGERPFRKELVDRIRKEIAEGIYDTPEKWEKALDRMLDDLEED